MINQGESVQDGGCDKIEAKQTRHVLQHRGRVCVRSKEPRFDQTSSLSEQPLLGSLGSDVTTEPLKPILTQPFGARQADVAQFRIVQFKLGTL